MRFSDSFLDEIRDRVPISQVIGTRVSWDRKKTNAPRGDYWACCPFHGEKSPSFHCEDKKGRYHCFGCGVSGDHFRFLTELDGMSFPEAVERIAEMAGVPMPARDAEADKRDQERAQPDRRHGTRDDSSSRTSLQSAAGARARAYLRDRGLSSATQQSFRLGYRSDSRNALKEFLAGKGVTKAQMEACGMVLRRRHAGFLRPFPRPHHVPDPRFQGPHHRLRRPRAVVGCAGQISEFAGDRALPQGQRALQLRARPQGPAEGRHGDRRRGLHGRDRAGAGRVRERHCADRHSAYREPA